MDISGVKAHLTKADGSVETRRFPLSNELVSSLGLFKTVHEKVGNAFPDLKNSNNFSLSWKDSDGDYILMSTDEEMQDAISIHGNSTFQVYVQENQADRIQTSGEFQTTEKSDARNEEEMLTNEKAREDFPPFGFLPGMIPPPPPPPHLASGGPWAGTGRGGRHGKAMGRWMGFHGGFMGPGPFGMHPHFGGFRRGGHFGPRHHGHHHHHRSDDEDAVGCQNSKRGAKMWKAELRVGVPQLHRRWAKMFIQKWRQEHLTNATTTTSDNGTDEELTIEMAGVPVAYKSWLELMLPRWHRKWGADKVNGEKANKECANDIDKKERQQWKTSVSNEFRRWVKWYLQRHFGQREAPKLKRQCGKNLAVNTGMCQGYERPGNYKKNFLASLVPSSHRSWAKKFIHDWRVQKKLEEPATSTTTSESDDGGVDIDQDDTTRPQDYGLWLEVFLPRWHHWRGLIEKKDMQEEKKITPGRFKDTVPMDFRAWVKHYLSRRYGRQRAKQCLAQNDEEAMMQKYRGWLAAFQKKWLEEQKSMEDDSEDCMFLTSGDEEDPLKGASSDDNGVAPDKSFKRLRLSDDEDETRQRNVHFDPSLKGTPLGGRKMQKKRMKRMMKLMMDSDDGADEMEIRRGRRKFPINHGFRKWVWQELNNWDGQSTAQTSSQQEAASEIPPHVYLWMSKVMMKMQKRNLKQEMKAAKREMKASHKLTKAEMRAAKSTDSSNP